MSTINKDTAKEIKIYTTAKDSDYRFSLTDTKQFFEGSQPPETVNSIFVNPDRPIDLGSNRQRSSRGERQTARPKKFRRTPGR